MWCSTRLLIALHCRNIDWNIYCSCGNAQSATGFSVLDVVLTCQHVNSQLHLPSADCSIFVTSVQGYSAAHITLVKSSTRSVCISLLGTSESICSLALGLLLSLLVSQNSKTSFEVLGTKILKFQIIQSCWCKHLLCGWLKS